MVSDYRRTWTSAMPEAGPSRCLLLKIVCVLLTLAESPVERVAPVSGRARVAVRAHGAPAARLHAASARVAHRVPVALARRAAREVPPAQRTLFLLPLHI